MPKSDLSVPNSDGLTYRSNVNTALQSLASMQAGTSGAGNIASLPTTVYENQFFYDASDGKIKQRQNGAWVVIGDRSENWGLATKASPSFSGTATFAGPVELTGTSYFKLPSGTDAQRPGSPAAGMIRWNSQQGRFEGYYGSAWNVLTTSLPIAANAVGSTELAPGAVKVENLNAEVTRARIRGKRLATNHFNTYTASVVSGGLTYTTEYFETYGRGNTCPVQHQPKRNMFIASDGYIYHWGQSSYYQSNLKQVVNATPRRVAFRRPKWMFEAMMGDSTALAKYGNNVAPTGRDTPRQSSRFYSGSWFNNSHFIPAYDSGFHPDEDYSYHMPRVADAWSCWYHNAYLLENGSLFMSGYGTYISLLGNGISGQNVPTPTEVTFYDTNSTTPLDGSDTPNIVQFVSTSLGQYNTAANTAHDQPAFAALDSSGNVYTWGHNSYGQLGIGSTSPSYVHYARKLPRSEFGNEDVKYLSAGGGDLGYFHAITGSGACYAWGRNNYGQLGDTTTTDKNSPTLLTSQSGNNLNGKSCFHVIATSSGDGLDTTHFLTTEGQVYGCGYSAADYGVGIGIYKTSTAATNVTNPTALTDSPYVANTNKIVAMFRTGGQAKGNLYLIADGYAFGGGYRRLAFSCGDNSNGQLGRGAPTTSPANASGQFAGTGNSDDSWFLREIKFRDYGLLEQGSPTATTGYGETIGKTRDVVSGTTTSIWPANTTGSGLWMGQPCAFYSNRDNSSAHGMVVMLDTKGQIWHCGSTAGRTLNDGVVWNDTTGDSVGNLDHEDYFAPWLQQPEQAVGFSFNEGAAADLSITFVGESGLVYTAGHDHSGHATGHGFNNTYTSISPLPITAG